MTYSKSILEFKRKALAMGLCWEYRYRWAKAQTYRDLVELATDINGADFLCSSVARGWGLSKDFILQNALEYINGEYVARTGIYRDYTSELFVGYNGEITVRTTILVVLYSDVTIYVPQTQMCRIFAAGNSKIDIQCDGYCEFTDYTPKDEIKSNGGNGRIFVVDPKKDSDSWVNFNFRKR